MAADLALLEFDDDRDAVIDPRVAYARHLDTIPERVVL